MLSILNFSFTAVAPIILLIILGYFVKKLGVFDQHTLKQLNKFNFRFPFCVLMFNNIYSIDLKDNGFQGGMLGVLCFCLVLLTVLGWIMANLVTRQKNRKGVLMQAMFRSNYAIIGLALAEALAGESGAQLASMFQLPTVIYYNFMSVIVLNIYSDQQEERHLKKTALGVLKNPLIQGLLAGALALIIRSLLPMGGDGNPVFTIQYSLPWLYQALKWMGNIATPMALIVLGAQLEFGEIAGFKKELISGVLMRLVGAPVIGFCVVFLAMKLGILIVGSAEASVFVAAFGSPLAVSAVVMASEMGGDDRLAGEIVVWTSILGMFSLFVLISLLRMLGWL